MRCQLACLLLAALCHATHASTPVIPTHDGAVKGYTFDGVANWLGIPFAAPPVGNLRFRPPQPPKPWNTTRDAIFRGPICPQLHIGGPLALGNEDCLYLNVHAPEGHDPQK